MMFNRLLIQCLKKALQQHIHLYHSTLSFNNNSIDNVVQNSQCLLLRLCSKTEAQASIMYHDMNDVYLKHLTIEYKLAWIKLNLF